ncbi:rho guanine nucleotide exchange factor 40 isoform X2 [Lepisosteus oculatus]|uniref:rho guanine nucleotide exchange factor 40 isoform X2 n=1 Tax=Lepisosteus oculatus TaxID=7918 RepID=UPI00371E876A
MGSEAVEDCVQGALSSLYPPFEATAPPLLGQVFSVLEGTYRHDALRYLLDYFVPAKNLLHRLQQQACSQYVGCLFIHQGWPLCLGERVVVQLSTLDWRLMGPRDFYLQVVPFSTRSPRLALKCLSSGGRTVQEVLIPETQHAHVFTPEWLNGINKERGGGRRLETCLVTTGEGLVKVPWEDIVYPRFVPEPECPLGQGPVPNPAPPRSQGKDANSVPGRDSDNEGESQPESGGVPPVAKNATDQDKHLETLGEEEIPSPTRGEVPKEEEAGGDYVELLEFQGGTDVGGRVGSDSKRRYLEMHGICKTKTVPLCKKGKGGKGRRAKAWVHCRNEMAGGMKKTSSSSSSSSVGGHSGKGDSGSSGEELSRPAPDMISLEREEKPDHSSHLSGKKWPVRSSGKGETDPGKEGDTGDGNGLLGSRDSPDGRANKNCEESGGDGEGMQTKEQSATQGTNHSTGTPEKDQSEETSGSSQVSDLMTESPQNKSETEGDQSLPGKSSADSLPTSTSKSASLPGQTNSQCHSSSGPGQDSQVAVHYGEAEEKAIPPRIKTGKAVGSRAHRRKRRVKGGRGKSKSSGQSRKADVKESTPLSEPKAPSPTHQQPELKAQPTGSTQEPPSNPPPPTPDSQSEPVQSPGVKDRDAESSTAKEPEIPPPQGDSQPRAASPDHSQGNVEQNRLPDQSGGSSCQAPPLLRDLNPELLQSGMLILPGTVDRMGRALVVMEARSQGWGFRDDEVASALACFHGLTRPPARQNGLTVIVDCRQAPPSPQALGALRLYQERVPHGLGSVLLLLEAETQESLPPPGGFAVEVQLVRGTQSLQPYVESEQLPSTVGGTRAYCHRDWISFRLRLESFNLCCKSALCLLGGALHSLETDPLPTSTKAVAGCVESHQLLMKSVLADKRLTQLQREGGATLARLRKEVELPHLTPDCRVALDVTSDLYDSVDDALHRLVRVSNQRGRDLEALGQLAALEERLNKCEQWLEEAEARTEGFKEVGDALELLSAKYQDFQQFSQAAMESNRQAYELLSELQSWAGPGEPGVAQGVRSRVPGLRDRLRDLSFSLEHCGSQLDKSLRLHSTLTEASQWSEAVLARLSLVPSSFCLSPSRCAHALSLLQRCRGDLPEIPASRFRDARALALDLGGGPLLERWSAVRGQYEETLSLLQDRLLLAQHCQRTKLSSTPSQSLSDLSSEWGPRKLPERKEGDWDSGSGGSDSGGTTLQSWGSLASLFKPLPSLLLLPQNVPTLRVEELGDKGRGRGGRAPAPSPGSTQANSTGSSSAPPRFLQALLNPSKKTAEDSSAPVKPTRRRNPSFDLQALLAPRRNSRDPGGRPGGEAPAQRGSPLLRLGRRVAEPPPPPAPPTALGQGGGGGVLIRGLEVSSREVVDQTGSPRQHVLLGRTEREMTALERHTAHSKVYQLWSRLLSSEREYVSVLQGVEEEFLPLMDSPDLPAPLRGKKCALFGNWEKLSTFHAQYLLPAIEGVSSQPLSLADCFLKYREHFLLYSQFIKTQPASDSQLVTQAVDYFKLRQQVVGCLAPTGPPRAPLSLPLCLQAPVQRLQEYCELLEELSALGAPHTPPAGPAALAVLRHALRHGWDLRASTLITGCPVELLEQGELLRQEELEVWGAKKKKGVRRVFLYRQLMVFTKPKTASGGRCVYTYKHSIKAVELGLTQTVGDSGLRFAVWVRQCRSRDSLTLQAPSPDSRLAWTRDIALLLWAHAIRNDELCLKESLCMGVSSQLLLDLQSGAVSLHDRDLNYILTRGGSFPDSQAPLFLRDAPPTLRPLSLELHSPSFQPGDDDFLGSSDSSSAGSGLSQKDLESPGSRKVTPKWPGQTGGSFTSISENISPSTAV